MYTMDAVGIPNRMRWQQRNGHADTIIQTWMERAVAQGCTGITNVSLVHCGTT